MTLCLAETKVRSSSQAINSGLVYVECPCDVSNRLAFRAQLRCNLRLVSIEFARPAEADDPKAFNMPIYQNCIGPVGAQPPPVGPGGQN